MQVQMMDSRPPLPSGLRIYAIGDIHGRADLLSLLLSRIQEDETARGAAGERLLIFLGDYVDRGPDSRGVAEQLILLRRSGVPARFLMGNHELMMLDFMGPIHFGAAWLRNGGDKALASYGVDTDDILFADWRGDENSLGALRDAFLERLPADHLAFYRELERAIHIGGYFFTHAGVRPGVPLDEQRPDDLLWIRDEFLTSQEDFGAVIVQAIRPPRTPKACLTGSASIRKRGRRAG